MSQETETKVTVAEELAESAAATFERLLAGLSDLAEAFQAKGKINCANRFMLAAGFLCLATWTMTGMSRQNLSIRLLQLTPMLSDIDCDSCPAKEEEESTSQASPIGSDHRAN